MKPDWTLRHDRRAMKRSTLVLFAAFILWVALPPSAAAQTSTPGTPSTFEVAGAYQALFVTDDPGTTFPSGFAVDLAIGSGAIGFVAEGGWSGRSESHGADDVHFDFWHAGVGLRWSRSVNARLRPYAQLLLGVAFHDVSGSIAGFGQSDTTANFMWQPGGGVNVSLGPRFWIFGAADYRRVSLDEDTEGDSALNELRLLVGVRAGF
jgi:hypothetical protein